MAINNYNPYPSIKLDFGKDNKWFYYLFEAIIRVDSSFIMYEMADSYNVGADKEETVSDHLERVFAYELYRQWANLLEEHGVKNLVINGEIGKCLKKDYLDDQTVSEIHIKDVFPDLVLHHSQGDDNNQLIICEIKRTKSLGGKDIFDDLLKLSCYMNSVLFWKKPFEYGVFIIAGKDASLNQIKITEGTTSSFVNYHKTIEEYKSDKEFKKKFNRIVCIAYNGITIEYQTLDKLLKTIIKKNRRRTRNP